MRRETLQVVTTTGAAAGKAAAGKEKEGLERAFDEPDETLLAWLCTGVVRGRFWDGRGSALSAQRC